ncbi:hypothetical protein GGR54DRAFT_495070 [Hypoxylon sp. NC1633]|nr:hypothetical protein GGR54DRAFT_495070 [Hypoxylon sp. NC1633]
MFRDNSSSSWFGVLILAATAGATLARRSAPTPTTPSESTSTTCDNTNQTTGYPDYDAFCKCPPYTADSPAFGNPYLGLVRCGTQCRPADATQTLVRPENDSLKSCMGACTGSFEKAKRGEAELSAKRDNGSWFCHGVNFIQGELCEFIGSVGTRNFVGGGSDCWYLNGLDGSG